MILLCAGRDSESDESYESDSSRVGEESSGLLGVVSMGREDSRRRAFGPSRSEPLPKRGDAVPAAGTAVPEDALREMLGRREVLIGVGGPALPGRGESRLNDRAEAVRPWPAPGSAPGIGEGADEPLAAAVAFLTCARSWE